MGYGGGDATLLLEQEKERKYDEFLNSMKQHPNYKSPVPIEGESKTRFILRAVGELISPDQEEDESYDLECVDIRKALKFMEKELDEIWDKYHQ